MTDIIGPILLIALIFALYYGAKYLDTQGDTKKSKLEIDKIQAETRMAEIDLKKREAELRLGELALEHQKRNQLEHTTPEPNEVEEAEYEVKDP